MVVSYLIEGVFRATRHAPGCSTLARAIREAESGLHSDRLGILRVVTESQFARMSEKQPRDHRCLTLAALETPAQPSLLAPDVAG